MHRYGKDGSRRRLVGRGWLNVWVGKMVHYKVVRFFSLLFYLIRKILIHGKFSSNKNGLLTQKGGHVLSSVRIEKFGCNYMVVQL